MGRHGTFCLLSGVVHIQRRGATVVPCEDEIIQRAASGDQEPFRPWLMRILYRHALDEMERQDIYRLPLPLDEVDDPHYQGGSNVSQQRDLQAWVAEREQVRQALIQLSTDQRRVIALRYGADLTEADIAQVLGWPIGTVKSRLNRARDRLRHLLEDERK